MVRVRDQDGLEVVSLDKKLHHKAFLFCIILQWTGIPSSFRNRDKLHSYSCRLNVLSKLHKPMHYLVACSANFTRAGLVRALISCWNSGDVPSYIRLTTRLTNANSYAVYRITQSSQEVSGFDLMPVLHMLNALYLSWNKKWIRIWSASTKMA